MRSKYTPHSRGGSASGLKLILDEMLLEFSEKLAAVERCSPCSDHMLADAASSLESLESDLKGIEASLCEFRCRKDALYKILRSRILRNAAEPAVSKGAKRPQPSKAVATDNADMRYALVPVVTDLEPASHPPPLIPAVVVPAAGMRDIPNMCLFNKEGSDVFCLKINNHVFSGSLRDVSTGRYRPSVALGSLCYTAEARESFPSYSWQHVNAGNTGPLIRWGRDLSNTRLISGRKDIAQLAHVNPHELRLRGEQLIHDLLVIAWLTAPGTPGSP